MSPASSPQSRSLLFAPAQASSGPPPHAPATHAPAAASHNRDRAAAAAGCRRRPHGPVQAAAPAASSRRMAAGGSAPAAVQPKGTEARTWRRREERQRGAVIVSWALRHRLQAWSVFALAEPSLCSSLVHEHRKEACRRTFQATKLPAADITAPKNNGQVQNEGRDGLLGLGGGRRLLLALGRLGGQVRLAVDVPEEHKHLRALRPKLCQNPVSRSLTWDQRT